MTINDGVSFGKVGAFRFWCQKVLPAVYDDSLSYYELLCKVIDYLNKVIDITNTQSDAITELQEMLKEFMDGEIGQYIEEKVDEWFEENEPEIMADIAEMQRQLAEMGMHNYSEPNFRCKDRFIFGEYGYDGVNSAQAGCVFIQDETLYWAQILTSSSANKDRLIIRDIKNNTTVASMTYEFGHGYTISYNPSTKQLLTQNSDSSPKLLILIDVEYITAPEIAEVISLTGVVMDNPCWYDDTHVIASIGNMLWGVFDLATLTRVDTYTLDLGGYRVSSGYIFQNICWYPSENKAYIGTTAPDGIALCDVDNDNKIIKMHDYIACKQYYGCLYMRELEMAYRVGDKMYINQFDSIDGQMVVSLLEWNMFNGTMPNENSNYIQPNGNLFLYVNYSNGQLIENFSDSNFQYKLAGDALNKLKSLGNGITCRLYIQGDYPFIIEGKACNFIIYTPDTTPITVKGFHFYGCDIVWSPTATISIEPSNPVGSGGQTYYAGILCSRSKLSFSGASYPLPTLVNPNNVSNPVRIYAENCEITSVVVNKTFSSDDWFRWGVANVVSASNIASVTTQNLIVNTVS